MKPRSLLIATFNKGKLQELRQILGNLPFAIRELEGLPIRKPIPESGETFVENATLKAVGYAKQSGLLTLADDSGLEVEALNGAPGVFSARYGHDGATDAERTSRLLAELSNVRGSSRVAQFVSVIAIADEAGSVINVSTGVCKGHIADAPRGANGFGYDPIFVPYGFHQTFAEMKTEEKNLISHRAHALADAAEFLGSLTVASDAD